MQGDVPKRAGCIFQLLSLVSPQAVSDCSETVHCLAHTMSSSQETLENPMKF